MYGYVYITTNMINGKIYIGQHKGSYNQKYYGSGAILRKAVKKYGVENFENHIIQWCTTEKELNEMEKYWISKYNSYGNTGIGYNVAIGGNSGNKFHGMTEAELKEYGKKITAANTGKKRSKEFCKRNKLVNLGRVHSDETKRKIREKAIGRKYDMRQYNCKCKECGKDFVGGNHNAKHCECCKIPDKLKFMLEKQNEFQKNLGFDFSKMNMQDKVSYIKDSTLWLQNEVNEMIYELPYAKHWSKKYDSWDNAKIESQIQLAKEEITDTFLFMMNICLCLGMDANEMLELYIKKNKINIDRQNTGY